MIAVVRPWRQRTIVLAGTIGVGAMLVLTTLASGIGDLALVVAAGVVAFTSVQFVRVRRWLDGLPLEIAPLGGSGSVNGTRVFRFRFRLGRGRPFRDLVVRVSFQPDSGGMEAELPVAAPQGLLYGPVTVVASDSGWATTVPGRFLVTGSCESAGARWEARAIVHSTAIREGSFGGIDVRNGRVEFSSDWTAVTAKERTATPTKR